MSEAAVPDVVRRWPQIGRDSEHDLAVAALTSLAPDAPRGVLLVGEAGVGKSALATRIEATIGTHAHVATVAPPAGAEPVLLSALASLVADIPEADLGSPVAMLRAIVDHLERDAAGRPIVLRVEDAHLLDSTSAALLRQVAASGRARLLLNCRSVPAVPDELVSMWKDDSLVWVDVEPLTRAEVGLLLRRVLGGTVAWTTDRRLWQASAGNPLYLRELIRVSLSRSELVEREGVWIWNGSAEPAEPATRLYELVSTELNRVPKAQRDVLELISLAEPVPVSLLLALANDVDVDHLIETHVLQVETQSSGIPAVRLSHPVYGETIRGLVPPGRRRALHQRMAAARFAADGGSLPGLLRRVSLAVESGEVRDPARLLEAAALANHLQDPHAAVRFAGIALSVPADDAVRAGALAERAEAYRMLLSANLAWADLDQLAALPAGSASAQVQGRAAVTGARLAYLTANDADRALQILDAAVDDVAGDSDASARVRGYRLATLLYTAQLRADGNGRTVEEAIAFLGDASLPLDARVRACFGLQVALGQRGRHREAQQMATAVLATLRRDQSPATAYIAEIRAAYFLTLLWSGDVHAATSLLSDESDLDLAGVAHYSDLPQVGKGLLRLAHGHWSDALDEVRAAVVALRSVDLPGMLAYALAINALAASWSGEFGEAVRLRAEALATPLRASAALLGDLRRALVWVALALDEDTADRQAIDLAEWAAQRGLAMIELDAWHTALLIAAARGPAAGRPPLAELAARVTEAAARCDGTHRAAAMVAHADALAAGDDDLAAAAEAALARHGVWVHPPRRGRRVTLTRREREVAVLAAAGLSSRDIAARLTISARTVDSHLARIYPKLGISSRADLSAVLGDR